ncbi:nucleic acid binding, OB-fold, tRNA/helicase-type [Methanocorpusculum labreanum Z]|uniref:Nucleic acid binding, OB-fold, tRNA/helicase-type n=1 Tax=Methanocorpusculum labreanum (strain ATCC 43576 / DSM 4855 / Z) TaxID=410358 RepID=A2STL0_METLZ|nr:hypothetical protein [Methanocorpusculum labreanum]ABN07666.1 nucleic acid binding, OB-fold, tRNA/helicase-type [Methanocorpusculum labreanum Z]
MKIKGVKLSLAPMHYIVVIFFIALFVWSFFATGDGMFLYWGIPLSLCLLAIPLINSYSVGRQYVKLLPEYEAESKPCRIKQLGPVMEGKAVRVEGVVQAVKGKFINRPGYKIFDGSGTIVAQRSTPLDISIRVGDNIQVVGMVVRRFAFAGDYVVHAIGVKKVDTLTPLEMDEALVSSDTVKIKKYN